MRDYVPRPDGAFNDWQNSFAATLTPNVVRFGIPTETFATLQTKKASWESRLAIVNNASSRTSAAVGDKNRTREDYEKFLRALVKEYLMYSSKVTDTERQLLGITVIKKSHTPVPVPSTVPMAKVKLPSPSTVTVYFSDSDAANRAKPAGVHGAEIAWAILDAQPADWSALTNSVFDTKSPYEFSFPGTERGKKLFFSLRWENTRGEKGRWSEIYEAVIP